MGIKRTRNAPGSRSFTQIIDGLNKRNSTKDRKRYIAKSKQINMKLQMIKDTIKYYNKKLKTKEGLSKDKIEKVIQIFKNSNLPIKRKPPNPSHPLKDEKLILNLKTHPLSLITPNPPSNPPKLHPHHNSTLIPTSTPIPLPPPFHPQNPHISSSQYTTPAQYSHTAANPRNSRQRSQGKTKGLEESGNEGVVRSGSQGINRRFIRANKGRGKQRNSENKTNKKGRATILGSLYEKMCILKMLKKDYFKDMKWRKLKFDPSEIDPDYALSGMLIDKQLLWNGYSRWQDPREIHKSSDGSKRKNKSKVKKMIQKLEGRYLGSKKNAKIHNWRSLSKAYTEKEKINLSTFCDEEPLQMLHHSTKF
ncbi:unnamed protein product [Moneuplotes crassus]|uniref:Uncharacterized protein n=1 Tax=Euplotes crassus TaxID=5936 RepID=A0AAD1XFW8_EUPCR|nr:unnamed protein product [Moneuplotes crassus]